MTPLDLEWIRAQFPALSQQINGEPAIFFDGPGGTQVTSSVIEAISDYLLKSNSNVHGAFATSARTDAVIFAARSAVADFLGCAPDEVVFGGNMTTLTFAFSRAIARQLQPGDEVVVTRLDHDANVTPWLTLEEKGVVVRFVDVNPDNCTLDMKDFAEKINSRTRLVAVGYASNATGTINDVAEVVRLARAVGSLVFIDAVHYAPHAPIDVRALDCDFLACSAYKFFAPHVGILYSKREYLANWQPYKVKPSSEEVPSRWETGTQNHEGLAGVTAAINYLAQLGQRVSPTVGNRREALVAAMQAIQEYERELSKKLVPELLKIPGLTLYGIKDVDNFAWRTPTVGIRIAGTTPETLAKILGEHGIFSWNGNFYAIGLTEKLGVESTGGFLRIGLVHYNSLEEVQRFLDVLHEILKPGNFKAREF
ncbi:MAG: cysteine desulfurase-like protein [Scytonematopsis contorta HA4267-MV1]|jgi:cysteine desulfurase family protein (TIGR01976 family)|nr:cysteine desulfurase-like protein [Scytonematopsis contorta HA4267-MV1]